ncbi:hypothetical protein CJD36_001500 [Flavipsychrobacter stenotrophus]|uniref:Peptidyl-prolyl cis-trans isomerase n=1 Tax=Flavipsychrobacter stenotrophus TaxID=2077091 RepID=A0A2S7SZU4_9BACT|nr:FKBP-type peptidyl-prolyl cis-trans isomerase [Flavipsychrobacter stenotrophus]PQJ12452.1 hypothetical protein CJD36_001500 [Flavipsychrobacter stenotrophus]
MKTLLTSVFLLFSVLVFGQSAPLAQQEDKALQDYFTANNIKAKPLASGVYMVVQKPGSGPHIHKRQGVTMFYTGKLLDGTTFDANVGKEPLKVHAGLGEVIKGMDIALLEMKYGSKVTIYIPSGVGYGAKAVDGIPANSILVFEIEIIGVL